MRTLPVSGRISVASIAGLAVVLTSASAQSSATRSNARPASPVEQAIEQSGKGQCEQALPVLKKWTASIAAKDLKYKALLATVRCAMNRKEDRTTVDALFDLRRDFPEDPQTLYMTSQIFLEIAERASQELATVAPEAYQTRELQAESLESQEKWAEAEAIYRKILEQNPKLRGIHYRLARAALSQPDSPTSTDDAKREFQAELEIDPYNAAAEFWLGELARRESRWDDAIQHFAAAVRIDSKFSDALLSLGTALNAAGKYAEAVEPLEKYIKFSPESLSGHYQLYMAYARTGRKDDSIREMKLHQELLEKNRTESNARSATPKP